MTFDQYLHLALEAGIQTPYEIGIGVDKYQLGRLGDCGDYELGNCRFITMRQNLDERYLNGGTQRAALKKSGRTKSTDAGVYAQAQKNKDRLRRKFKLIDPEGGVHYGDCLTDFCVEHGLIGVLYMEC